MSRHPQPLAITTEIVQITSTAIVLLVTHKQATIKCVKSNHFQNINFAGKVKKKKIISDDFKQKFLTHKRRDIVLVFCCLHCTLYFKSRYQQIYRSFYFNLLHFGICGIICIIASLLWRLYYCLFSKYNSHNHFKSYL